VNSSLTTGFDAVLGTARGSKRALTLSELLWLHRFTIEQEKPERVLVDELLALSGEELYEQSRCALNEQTRVHWKQDFQSSGAYLDDYPFMQQLMQKLCDEIGSHAYIENVLDLVWFWMLTDEVDLTHRQRIIDKSKPKVLRTHAHFLLEQARTEDLQDVFSVYSYRSLLFARAMNIEVGRLLYANQEIVRAKLGVPGSYAMSFEQWCGFAYRFIHWMFSEGQFQSGQHESDGELLEDSCVLRLYMEYACATPDNQQAMLVQAKTELKRVLIVEQAYEETLRQARLQASSTRNENNPESLAARTAVAQAQEQLKKAERQTSISNLQLIWLEDKRP
jgi:hypothetical protein